MIKGIQGRNLDGRARPLPDVTCNHCQRKVKMLKQVIIDHKLTLACYACAKAIEDAPKPCPQCKKPAAHFNYVQVDKLVSVPMCDDCKTALYAAPEPIVDALPVDPYCRQCFEPFTPKYAHQHRCAGCAEQIAAQWAAVPPTPKPPKLIEVPQWEKLIDHVLDAGKVVNRLDFAVPVDLRTVVDAYVAPVSAIDFAARLESKAAWNDDATRIAREQARALVRMMKTWKPEGIRKEQPRVLQAAA